MVSLAGEVDAHSVELHVRPFADLEDRPRIVAFSMKETPKIILGLNHIEAAKRQAFVESHLREAYTDPVSGDLAAWRGLLAILGEEGFPLDEWMLRALPFSVELEPRLIATLQAG